MANMVHDMFDDDFMPEESTAVIADLTPDEQRELDAWAAPVVAANA